MQLTINNILYTDVQSSTARLITTPQTSEVFIYVPQDALDNQNYPLSTRNGANVYMVPTDKDNIFINYIPKKLSVSDNDIQTYKDSNFSYFVKPEIIPPDLFTLLDGTIFRCVSENSVPKPKEDYTYYMMVGDIAKEIPNYKTLEVMLEERGQTLLAVRILTSRHCNDITKVGELPDKSASWNESMSDKTQNEVLAGLNQSVKSGAAMAEQAASNAASQVAAVQAQAEASKAEAEAAKAEAEAAKAASEQAIAEANAIKAQAEAQMNN